MGGLAALRIALKYPDRFLAVGASAPAVAPVFSYRELEAIDRWWPATTYETVFGAPVDDAYWQANHPLSIIKAQPDQLRRSAPEICVAVGDEDGFHLYRGADALHRLLTDEGIKHEFHLVRGVDHASISDLYFLNFFDAVLKRKKKAA
jgi:S-formylglutathione hydrolase FrmB